MITPTEYFEFNTSSNSLDLLKDTMFLVLLTFQPFKSNLKKNKEPAFGSLEHDAPANL